MQANTISIGYSDSEDRLWLRLSNQEESFQTWLHRRFVRHVLPEVWRLLSQTCSNPLAEITGLSSSATDMRKMWIQAEREAALDYNTNDSTKHSTSTSDDNLSPITPQQLGLISTINLSASSKWVEWSFVSPKRTLTLSSSRAEAHQLLQMLYTRQHEAQWQLPAPWEDAPTQ